MVWNFINYISSMDNNEIIKKFIDYIKKNKLALILFLVSTSFFIYQRISFFSWDFNSYVLNAKYWFAEGKYFEPLRPPLMPFIIGLFSFLGWRASEFFFIVLTSFLFMYSSIRLAKSIKFEPVSFYAISLSSYLLLNGLINGTELLSLVFLEFFVVFLIENKSSSGFFLGLSALSRYTNFIFFPLIFLHLKIKKILKSIILFGLAIFPWFLYNYYKFGNFFMSIADQYANNILFRDYLIQPIKISHFFLVQGILLPFFIIGFILVFFKLLFQTKNLKNHKKEYLLEFIYKLKIEIIMFVLFFFSIYSYVNIPLKDLRYLFSLTLPIFYFSYVGLDFFVKKIKKNRKFLISLSFIIFIFNILFLLNDVLYKEKNDKEIYKFAITKLDELNLSNCSIMSNGWVQLNYLGRPTKPFPRQLLIYNRLEEGEIFVFFKKIGEPDYVHNESFLSYLPIIYKDKDLVIVGKDKCIEIKSFEETYMQQLDKITFELYHYHQNQNPCFILFRNFSFLEKFCNFINFNGFKRDEYRKYG